MTLTPAQLDAIATKLLGWTPTRCPIHGTSCPESYYHKPDGTQGHGFLDVESPAAAMLVLEAMGKWCGHKRWVTCEGDAKDWTCAIYEWESPADSGPCAMAEADTPAAAIFQCAAQLVERM